MINYDKIASIPEFAWQQLERAKQNMSQEAFISKYKGYLQSKNLEYADI